MKLTPIVFIVASVAFGWGVAALDRDAAGSPGRALAAARDPRPSPPGVESAARSRRSFASSPSAVAGPTSSSERRASISSERRASTEILDRWARRARGPGPGSAQRGEQAPVLREQLFDRRDHVQARLDRLGADLAALAAETDDGLGSRESAMEQLEARIDAVEAELLELDALDVAVESGQVEPARRWLEAHRIL